MDLPSHRMGEMMAVTTGPYAYPAFSVSVSYSPFAHLPPAAHPHSSGAELEMRFPVSPAAVAIAVLGRNVVATYVSEFKEANVERGKGISFPKQVIDVDVSIDVSINNEGLIDTSTLNSTTNLGAQLGASLAQRTGGIQLSSLNLERAADRGPLLSSNRSADGLICIPLGSPFDGYFSPFSLDVPSEKLFQRNGSLAKLAPIINVAKEALNQPIPTNKWWGNLIHVTAKNLSENYPAWAQPYAMMLPKEPPYGLMAYYPFTYREFAPRVNGTVKYYQHGIHNDLTLSAQEFNKTKPVYEVYSWDDIGIKLRICDPSTDRCMDSALLSGMAFVSGKYDGLTPRIDTEYNITFVDDSMPGKFIIHLNNNQTWVLYASESISFRVEESVVFSVNASGSSLVADCGYHGTIRIAVLPEGAEDTVYDKYAPCVVRGGTISMESRTDYSIHWDVEGSTCESVGLLHFALPHQVASFTGYPTTASTPGAIVLHSATRGLMVAQVSNKWCFLEVESDIKIDFWPARRPSRMVVEETDMLRTLQDDITANWSMNASSWYFNGKYFQKYASLCLMAADSSVVGPDTTLLSFCLEKLEKLVEPLLNNTLIPPLVYETLYRGIVSRAVFDTGELYIDFGNGIYNDHHYHYGYYVTSAAIMKYLNPNWCRLPELEALIWLMLRDVVNPSLYDCHFPRFRHFSWFHGHSYSRGVTLLDHGKDEESTSEDINFYYGMSLWGKVTGHKAVEDLGSLMLRLNAHAIRTYFLLTSDNTVQPPVIVENHVTGIFFDNKVFYSTWFLDKVYAIHGIQMLPVIVISEIFRTPIFVTQEWNDILSKDEIVTTPNSNNSWLSLLLVNAATVDPMNSLLKLKNATMDDGLTLAWALYNAATRGRQGIELVGSVSQEELTIDVELSSDTEEECDSYCQMKLSE